VDKAPCLMGTPERSKFLNLQVHLIVESAFNGIVQYFPYRQLFKKLITL